MVSHSLTLRDLRSRYHQGIAQGILNPTERPEPLAVKSYLREGLERRSTPARDATVAARRVPRDKFVEVTKEFVQESFHRIEHLRPGDWAFRTSQRADATGDYYDADVVRRLQHFLRRHPEVRFARWMDFFVTPDITIARMPVTDNETNKGHTFVTDSGQLAKYTPLRREVNTKSILHASISCKWTIRSDRSQNTRTEALNLIRNRKGKVPIVVAVVFEPLPTRVASIALGTGDLDCVYYGALYELCEAVEETGKEDQKDMLDTLVQGRRLRDISDLPFDLAT